MFGGSTNVSVCISYKNLYTYVYGRTEVWENASLFLVVAVYQQPGVLPSSVHYTAVESGMMVLALRTQRNDTFPLPIPWILRIKLDKTRVALPSCLWRRPDFSLSFSLCTSFSQKQICTKIFSISVGLCVEMPRHIYMYVLYVWAPYFWTSYNFVCAVCTHYQSQKTFILCSTRHQTHCRHTHAAVTISIQEFTKI